MTSLVRSNTSPNHHRRIVSACRDQVPVVVCPADVCDMRRMTVILLMFCIFTLEKRKNHTVLKHCKGEKFDILIRFKDKRYSFRNCNLTSDTNCREKLF